MQISVGRAASPAKEGKVQQPGGGEGALSGAGPLLSARCGWDTGGRTDDIPDDSDVESTWNR